MTHSEALIPALAAKYGISYHDVLEIGAALLKELHRVAVMSEDGPVEAIYESEWLFDEEGQYHLTGIVAEITRPEAPHFVTGLITDVSRYVSPERDQWNEELRHWMDSRSPQRVEIDRIHG